MRKEVKGWIAIIVGFIFLGAIDIFDDIIRNINVQIVFNILCIIIALISFSVAIISDKSKFSIKKVLHNRYIILSLVLAIIIFLLLMLFVINI